MSPRKHLAAHWSFDDRGTTTAKDVTGRGNDGRILGCTRVEGKVGRALKFGKGKYVELYVDGKLAAAEKTPGPIPGNCGQGMKIGFDAGNSPAEITDNFEGIIDEVKVYQAALSGEEIARQGRSEPQKPQE